ncbi:MAG: hypothetical protein AB7N76_26510 [Planctomycetota bacterium]
MARLHIIIGALLLTACAGPVVDVTVSAPRVYGDDHVLRTLADRHAQVRPPARGALGAPTQESLGVRHDAATRLAATADLVGPSADEPEAPAAPAHPDRCRCARCAALILVAGAAGPFTGPTSSEVLRQRLDLVDDVLAHERRSEGDAALLGPRARAVLLRFDVCFNAYLDLGARRRFVVVAFRVRGKDPRTPAFEVHLLVPELRSITSDEWLVDAASSELAASLLGSWGGTGLTAGWSSRDRLEERFGALLTTPLQFGIYRGRGNVEEPAFTFAFAFGPRRRLLERALLNPARWFGSSYELAYELQPGPRACEAVLVFPEVAQGASLDLVVEVFCDGALVSEEEVDVARALGRPLSSFDVACPPLPLVGPTAAVDLDPRAGADLVLDSGPDGPAFTVASQVLVGPVALPPSDVLVLGRGRLLVRARPEAALLAALQRGATSVPGRVLTPDQPDFAFTVNLVAPERPR